MLQDLFEKPIKMDGMAAKAAEATELLSMMANPVRLLLLCSLLEGQKSVNELVVASYVSQSTVSQHLAKLRSLRLVATRRVAQTIYYRLASAEVQKILTTLHGIYCYDKEREMRVSR